jgi:Flp pilus assembly protein TadD
MNRRYSRTVFFLLVGSFLMGCQRKDKDASATAKPSPASSAGEFKRLMNVGKNYYEKGEAKKAVASFREALPFNPAHPDAHLNLANGYLLEGDATNALAEAMETLELDHASAAAHYVAGCADMRLGRFEPALQEFQTARDIDPTVAATSFQLGLAHFQLKHWEEAAAEFKAALELDPKHPAAHYNLSQALIRLGKNDEAAKELETHQKLAANNAGTPPNAATYERSKFTEARTPFEIEEPLKEGIPVTFTDQTAIAFGNSASSFDGPIGVMDVDQRGMNDLFVIEHEKGFRLLLNSNGVFRASGQPLPTTPGTTYQKMLVGDLQNDRFEDVIALGDKGTRVFRFATNGAFTDVSAFSKLASLAAIDGDLVDLDFTGKLDLIAITANTNSVRVFRNLGNLYFQDISATSGVPTGPNIATQMRVNDWNNDDMNDLFLAREGQPIELYAKQRGGNLVGTNSPSPGTKSSIFAVGDLNNDGRVDLVVATPGGLEISFGGSSDKKTIPFTNDQISTIAMIDYDNDGWLDICSIGNEVRLWRNLGPSGFEEKTKATGLDKIAPGSVASMAFADFDQDGDGDFIFALKKGGVQLWRNEGGNKNQLLKLRLVGNRSNASGLGVKVEVAAGGLRLVRTITKLPIEIGVGQHTQLDSCTVRWFDLSLPTIDVKVERLPIPMVEITIPGGSCPYLYAWDGQKYRFVTDILGAAPVGLPISEKHYIEADPEEFVWIGNDGNFKPREGQYAIQITEELREVLFLDETKLFAAYHPEGTEVHPTDKLLPGKPFPTGELWTLAARKPLLSAVTHEGGDVTDLLQKIDERRVSPSKLREPQLRGWAEPYSVTLDFGSLETEKPLVLALTGWLRFGGGMANISASQRQDLSYPFPVLEVEAGEKWHPVPVTVGAPAGKTKTILVDLAGKLPLGSRRLRLSAAFEIHWDRIALFEHAPNTQTTLVSFSPSHSDLHWRGFSEFADLPWTFPLTPQYEQVRSFPYWRITPTGYCTRYGEVDELLAKRDEALVLLNGGDELSLTFSAEQFPKLARGQTRDFFLYSDGWDKDADFHVAQGWMVEPLPHHGMDDQQPVAPRPVFPSDELSSAYNTRFVAPLTFPKKTALQR